MSDSGENVIDMNAHLQEVGLLCSQWAYLEWMLEIALWWLHGDLAKPEDERTMSGMSIGPLARLVRDEASTKLKDQRDVDSLREIAERIENAKPERDLAVHGVRDLLPGEIVVARVTRGKYKGTLQRLPMIRLGSLNAEVQGVIALIEPLLLKHGAIEGITEASRRSPDEA